MAEVAKRRVVINPARRSGKKRRNAPKHMTAKQIKFFGTPAQKAALKRSRSRAAQRTNRASQTRRKASRAAHRPAARKRSNPGEILSLVLNPGQKKGKSMAATKRKRSSGQRKHRPSSHKSNTRRHHRRRTNPASAPRRRRYNKPSHRRRQHNPSREGGMGSLKANATFLLAGAAGYFGSKVLTQAVMGPNNTGVAGYFGNAIATAGLALAAYMFKFKRASAAIVAGGAIQVIARVLTDQTPFGQFTSSLGVGDYQMESFVTPQRLKDPLNSAEIEIPPGWAPTTIVSSAAPPAKGHAGYATGGMGRGMYSGRGLYS